MRNTFLQCVTWVDHKEPQTPNLYEEYIYRAAQHYNQKSWKYIRPCSRYLLVTIYMLRISLVVTIRLYLCCFLFYLCIIVFIEALHGLAILQQLSSSNTSSQSVSRGFAQVACTNAIKSHWSWHQIRFRKCPHVRITCRELCTHTLTAIISLDQLKLKRDRACIRFYAMHQSVVRDCT